MGIVLVSNSLEARVIKRRGLFLLRCGDFIYPSVWSSLDWSRTMSEVSQVSHSSQSQGSWSLE